MLPVLTNLLVLQERDLKLDAITDELGAIPKEALKIKAGLTQKRDALGVAKQAQLTAEKAVKQVDLDRQTRKDTITKLKMRQGETKRNEEYLMLSHEITRYTEQIDELETQELELMEKADLAKAARATAAEALSQEKEFATERGQALVARKTNLEAKKKELLQNRDKLAAKVEPSVIALYDRLRSASNTSTQREAVTVLTPEGKCTGCNMKLPPAVLHQVQIGAELVQCGECSRILYIA